MNLLIIPSDEVIHMPRKARKRYRDYQFEQIKEILADTSKKFGELQQSAIDLNVTLKKLKE